MRRDVIYSVILHVVALSLTAVSFPLSHKTFKPGEVIKVTLTAGLPGPPASTPGPAPVVAAPVVKAPPKDAAKALPDPRVKRSMEKPKPNQRKVHADEEASALADQAAKYEIKTQNTGAGSPFAGAAIDNPNFDYPDWFTLAFRKIQINWSNQANIDGTVVCVVSFQVIRSGRVIDPKIIQSSGIGLFDQGCLAAVTKSSPFPPLPSDFADEIIGITVPFKYPNEAK